MPEPPATIDRRTLLGTTGLTASTTLAGCSRGDSETRTSPTAASSPVETSPEAVRESGRAGLGKPFGWTAQYSTTVDPADYEDDSAAIQGLVDDLFANMDGGTRIGHLVLPTTKRDGSEWTFPRTVSLGSDEPTDTDYPRGRVVLPHGRGPSRIRTTIDDGSPLFHLDPVEPVRIVDTFGGFRASGGRRDNEFVRITSCMYWELKHCFCGGFAAGPKSTAAYVVDANSYNWFMYNDQWWGSDPEYADVFGFDDTRGVRAPATDGHIFLDVHKPCRYAVNNNGVASNVGISGHVEGHRKAGIKWTNSGGPATKVLISDRTWFWSPKADHHIHVDNCMATVSQFYAGACGGDVVRIGPNTRQFHVSPFVTTPANVANSDVGGLSVAEGAGTQACTVPFPEELPLSFELDSLVGNEHVVFPNGRHLAAMGTVDVPADGRQRVALDDVVAVGDVDVRYGFADDGASEGQVVHDRVVDDSGIGIEFTQRSGTAPARIEYRVFA
jgi:hypothetical protein